MVQNIYCVSFNSYFTTYIFSYTYTLLLYYCKEDQIKTRVHK